MNNFTKGMIAVAVGIVIIVTALAFRGGVGGTTNFDALSLSEGLTVAGATTFSGDSTVSGGTLNVTTSNTATSTAKIGCVQTYATSTATAVRFVIGSIATSSTSYGGTDTVGLVGWQYGACPNL